MKKIVTERLKGIDIPGDIKSDKDGKPIDSKLNYIGKKVVEVNLNHYKKMKQNYQKAGMAGAAFYAHSVKEHVKQKQLSS